MVFSFIKAYILENSQNLKRLSDLLITLSILPKPRFNFKNNVIVMYLSNIPKFMDSYEEEGLDIDFSLYFSNISIEFNTKTERFSIINCDDFIDSERLYQSLNHEEIQKFQSLVQNYIIEKFKENEFKIIQLTIDIPFEYIHPNNNIDKLYRDALFRPCNSQKFIIFLNCAELMGFWNFTNCIDQGIQAWSMINLKYHFYSYNLYIPNFNPVYKDPYKSFKPSDGDILNSTLNFIKENNSNIEKINFILNKSSIDLIELLSDSYSDKIDKLFFIDCDCLEQCIQDSVYFNALQNKGVNYIECNEVEFGIELDINNAFCPTYSAGNISEDKRCIDLLLPTIERYFNTN